MKPSEFGGDSKNEVPTNDGLRGKKGRKIARLKIVNVPSPSMGGQVKLKDEAQVPDLILGDSHNFI